MCLRFVFLLIARQISWLQLSQRKETWKTADFLILRHLSAIMQLRDRPHTISPSYSGSSRAARTWRGWADRALLATLLGVIPKARRHRLRLLVTPPLHTSVLPETAHRAAQATADIIIKAACGAPRSRRGVTTVPHIPAAVTASGYCQI